MGYTKHSQERHVIKTNILSSLSVFIYFKQNYNKNVQETFFNVYKTRKVMIKLQTWRDTNSFSLL